MCFAIGWLLGYPALRVQHHYLAFVTLAFTTLVFLFLRNEEWLTNGIYGINAIERPTFFSWSTGKAIDFYFYCLGILAALSLATWWMLRSPWGRAFVALRENPIRALSLERPEWSGHTDFVPPDMARARDVSPLPTETVDTVVIGGGVAGSCLAYWLSREGIETLVVERDDVNLVRLVDLIQQRRQRGRLAAARAAGHEDKSVFFLDDLVEHRRELKLFHRRYF